MLAVGGRHGVFVKVVQLVVHIARGVDVYARGDERNHAKHEHGQRVDVIPDRQPQVADLDERVPIAGVIDLAAVSVVTVFVAVGLTLGSRMPSLPWSAPA